MRKFLILLASLGIAGCCSLQKCEELVGACEAEKEFVEVVKTVHVIPPAVAVPPQVVLEVESWTVEMIQADPVGYEEVLIQDLLKLLDMNIAIIDYLEQLEAARQKAVEAAGGSS